MVGGWVGRGRVVRGICFKESNVKLCSAVDLCWTKHLHRTKIPTEKGSNFCKGCIRHAQHPHVSGTASFMSSVSERQEAMVNP